LAAAAALVARVAMRELEARARVRLLLLQHAVEPDDAPVRARQRALEQRQPQSLPAQVLAHDVEAHERIAGAVQRTRTRRDDRSVVLGAQERARIRACE